MKQITIPRSIEEARVELDGLGKLLTAKQWERAAIVYAFTTDSIGGGPRTAVNLPQLSARAFADLGIEGLRSDGTVRNYRKAWQSAIDDHHAIAVKPGDKVELPGLPWKDAFGESTADVQQRVFRQVLREPDAIRDAVRDDPGLAYKIAGAAMAIPTARNVVESMLANEQQTVGPRMAEPWTPTPHDYRTDLVRAAGLITGLVRAIQRGEWEPSTTEAMLLHSLTLLISQANPETEPDAELFSDIERYLAEGAAR